jgi:hypothetical protein
MKNKHARIARKSVKKNDKGVRVWVQLYIKWKKRSIAKICLKRILKFQGLEMSNSNGEHQALVINIVCYPIQVRHIDESKWEESINTRVQIWTVTFHQKNKAIHREKDNLLTTGAGN